MATERRPARALARPLVAVALALSAPCAHALTVFACEPEWAALTRVLLPSAKVHLASLPGQDPHDIEARPSLIAQWRGSHLAVCTGAGLESGWLPVLQQRAGRAVPLFEAADHVELIDPNPGAVGSPWAGDVHAEGNPHLHLHPAKLLETARALAETLQGLAPTEAGAIKTQLHGFEARWRAAMARWQHQAAPLRGLRVAAQHSTFGYVWLWLGLQPVADLEPKPGMAPTPGHLQRLVDGLRATRPAGIVLAQHQDPRAGRWMAAQLGVPLLVLPSTVDEDLPADPAAALLRWMDRVVGGLSTQLAPAPAAKSGPTAPAPVPVPTPAPR